MYIYIYISISISIYIYIYVYSNCSTLPYLCVHLDAATYPRTPLAHLRSAGYGRFP